MDGMNHAISLTPRPAENVPRLRGIRTRICTVVSVILIFMWFTDHLLLTRKIELEKIAFKKALLQLQELEPQP